MNTEIESRSRNGSPMDWQSGLTLCLILVALWMLGGCATTSGAPRVISAAGAVPDTPGVAAFSTAEAAARAVAPDDLDKSRVMLALGFPLIKANCSDFFSTAGNTQRWLIFTRDAVGAIGTLATAVMALHDASQTAVSNVALATSATFMGLDIYTKNFLFAAENVDSVRTLTMKALSVHEDAVSQLGDLPYGPAVTALLDNQNICAPMHIAALARQAIQRGDVVADGSLGQGTATVTQKVDEQVLRSLGQILNPPGYLSVQEAGALWWLLKDASSSTERTQQIAPGLAGLPSSTDPFDRSVPIAPTLKAPWPQQQAVVQALDQFSNATKASFRSAIAAARTGPAPAGGGGGVAAAAAPPGPATFKLNAARAQRSSGHIGVGIR